MNIILYSTGCPKCHILETKLKQHNLSYTIIDDIDIMQSKGFMTVPVLEVNNIIMDFTTAIKWINEYDKKGR